MAISGVNGMTHTSWDVQVIYDRTDAGSYRLGKTVDAMQWS